MQNHGGFSSIRYVSLFLKAAQTYDKHYYMILADGDWYMPNAYRKLQIFNYIFRINKVFLFNTFLLHDISLIIISI